MIAILSICMCVVLSSSAHESDISKNESSCKLDSFNKQNIFTWKEVKSWNDKTIIYENKYGKNCPFVDFAKNPKLLNRNKKIRILTFGDSLDEDACKFMIKDDSIRNGPAIYSSSLKTHEHGVYNCSNIYFSNFDYLHYSIHGSTINEGDKVVYRGSLPSEFKAIRQRMNKFNYSPTHISFGSFAWDMQAAYLSYCFTYGTLIPSRDKNAIPQYYYEVKNPTDMSCLCNDTMRRSQCAMSPYEVFQGLALPWCSDAVHDFWKESYMKNVHLLHSLFPKAIIFLRTQPPSAIIKLGNSYCQNYMNNQIRYWVRSGKHPYLRLLDYDSLLHSQVGRSFDKLHYTDDRNEWVNLLVNTVLDLE